ncbi:hypothetical protein ED312_15960 [Sinomicrobium pectinilyticum]|uniref:Uncharacterized protein n=1 Tax=Sinomicrobium pectinilyticum TaxID=1084421 RepID=A0A3N0E505_SINP1|nr:hypothetical protein ED312_15960 [Sinomicrobium pectinilyticum]
MTCFFDSHFPVPGSGQGIKGRQDTNFECSGIRKILIFIYLLFSVSYRYQKQGPVQTGPLFPEKVFRFVLSDDIARFTYFSLIS